MHTLTHSKKIHQKLHAYFNREKKKTNLDCVFIIHALVRASKFTLFNTHLRRCQGLAQIYSKIKERSKNYNFMRLMQ
jgi:hypothetical protein